MASNAETVRALFDAYLAQDRDAADALLADDFVFSSPQDDFIDKTRWLDVCFPTASRVAAQRLTDVAETNSNDVFVRYVYELRTGEHHRNCEVITVHDGKVTEVQVYFGAELTDRAPADSRPV